MNPIYVHRKRKTEYQIVSKCLYADAIPAYEDDKLELSTSRLVFATSKSDEWIMHVNGELGFRGSLQCSLPVQKGHWLICYTDIDNEYVWYRPLHEFFDSNRFFVKGTKEN